MRHAVPRNVGVEFVELESYGAYFQLRHPCTCEKYLHDGEEAA